ncbi:MAG: RluA family pseudouridine synthase [Acidobacteria bacterium]|nr:MAG: RluA family pseudouridine synthase [Acidobacteriota bacterium]
MRGRAPGRQPAVFSKIKILFEDQAVIVVDKPAGLLTIATDREKERTLYAWLFNHVKRRRPPEKIFIVHRLDREASGLLVFAKTPEAKQFLQQQFSKRSAGRVYKAVVEGRVAEDVRTLRSYLAENRAHRSYSTSQERLGKLAVTHTRVVQRSPRRTLLEIKLDSGRKHQIRVHMAEWGHPIVGDKVYGSSDNRIGRLALHAERLAFTHPITGERRQFESPCPASFLSLRG